MQRKTPNLVYPLETAILIHWTLGVAVAENSCFGGAQQIRCFPLPEDGNTFETQYFIKNYTMKSIDGRLFQEVVYCRQSAIRLKCTVVV
jgi:hypothetical protein